MSENKAHVGGWSETRDADEEIQKICDKVKPDVEKKMSESYSVITALQYRSQVVTGFNYHIKVHVGGDRYLHLRVWHRPYEEPVLTGLEKDHNKDDPILTQ